MLHDYIANEFPKTRYMTNGQMSVPLVVRTGNGAGVRFGAQHWKQVPVVIRRLMGLVLLVLAWVRPVWRFWLRLAAILLGVVVGVGTLLPATGKLVFEAVTFGAGLFDGGNGGPDGKAHQFQSAMPLAFIHSSDARQRRRRYFCKRMI